VHHKTMYLEDQRVAVLSRFYLFYCQVTWQQNIVCLELHLVGLINSLVAVSYVASSAGGRNMHEA